MNGIVVNLDKCGVPGPPGPQGIQGEPGRVGPKGEDGSLAGNAADDISMQYYALTELREPSSATEAVPFKFMQDRLAATNIEVETIRVQMSCTLGDGMTFSNWGTAYLSLGDMKYTDWQNANMGSNDYGYEILSISPGVMSMSQIKWQAVNSKLEYGSITATIIAFYNPDDESRINEEVEIKLLKIPIVRSNFPI